MQGAKFGYQPGGWGKPPVDEFGRPLYGDVFSNINYDVSVCCSSSDLNIIDVHQLELIYWKNFLNRVTGAAHGGD